MVGDHASGHEAAHEYYDSLTHARHVTSVLTCTSYSGMKPHPDN
jgi:hypothetical protein